MFAAYGIRIVSQNVTKNFIQHFRLHRLLHEMLRALLQRRQDVLLIAHRRHHHDSRIRVLPHDPLHRLNSFHLWHGDVHQHDVRLAAVIFRDRRQPVACFPGHFPAELLDHLDQVFAGEDGVVHHQIADRLLVFPK